MRLCEWLEKKYWKSVGWRTWEHKERRGRHVVSIYRSKLGGR